MTGKQIKRAGFWQADWFAGLVLVLVSLVLYTATDLVGTLERRFYDVASTANKRLPSDRIAVIAIDDQSIANLGRWPWPRSYQAKLIDLLAQAKAKTVVQTVFFLEPQVDPGLVYIRKLKGQLGSADASSPEMQAISATLAEAETALDTDAVLTASLGGAKNVLLSAVFALGEPQGKSDQPLPDFVAKQAIDDTMGFAMPSTRGQMPIELLGREAAGIGHLNQFPDQDGAVRAEPLLVNYYGKAVPSMALLAVMKSLNLGPADIQLKADTVQIGRLKIKTEASTLMLPQFYRDREGRPAFQVDSFYDVLSGKFQQANTQTRSSSLVLRRRVWVSNSPCRDMPRCLRQK